MNPVLKQMMQAQEQAKQAKDKGQDKKRKSRLAEASEAMKQDMAEGAKLGQEIIGDGLGRMSEDANLTESRNRLADMAGGPTTEQNLAQREQALERLQGQEASQQRSLLSSLSNAGQVGGSAAAQLADLTSSNLANRRRMERDLIADQTTFGQQAARDVAQLDQSISQFDLGQLAKEKNIDIQARLGYADLGSAERAGIRSSQAIEDAAKAQKGGGKK